MENIKPKLPCPYPWMHHVISTTGSLTPCCHVSVADDKTWNSVYMTEGLDSKKFIETRDMMRDGVWPAICGTCKSREALGITSPRMYAIEKYDSFTYSEVKLTSLDIKFTNTCNLMCRMCFPGSSSLIEKFYTNHERPKFMAKPQSALSNADEKVKYVKTAIENGLEKLKVTGGEPFACKYFMEVLDWCIANKHERKLSLTIITNGTKFSKAVIKKMMKFKTLNVIVSIDGTDAVYQYIRHKSTWEKLCKNMDNLINLKTVMQDRLTISINCTLQSYNLHNIAKLAQYANTLGVELYISTNLLPKDGELSVKWLPDSLIDSAIEELNALNGLGIEFNKNDVITYLSSNKKYNKDKCNDLLKTTLLYDKQRGENYQKSLDPRMVNFLDSINE